MSIADIPQLQKLSDREKFDLAHELLQSIEDPELRTVSEPELETLLASRWTHFQAHPESALTIEDFQRLVEERRER